MTSKNVLRSSLALAASLMVLASYIVCGADTPPGEVTLTIEATKEHPRNSEGSFATLASGRIIYCYSQFYNGGDDESPARIARIHSDDHGLTWSEPEVVVENKSGCNVMSVSLLRLASGKLAMFYLVKNSWIDCHPYMRISSDDGATWTEEKRVLAAPGYFVMNNDRVIQTRKGRIIIPLAFHRSRGEDPKTIKSWDFRAITLWIYSDDDGATWQEASSWWAMPVRSARGLQEPGVVEQADGSLFSWSRTDQGEQYGFTSADGGNTWTPPFPTELKSPTAPASIKRLPGSADLLAIYNDHSGKFPFTKGKRTPLVAAISSDGGKTWPQRKLIESNPDGRYHYTAIYFVGDAVLLAYCAGDDKVGDLNRLRIRRISLEWLRQP
jgi:sialidase-1